MNTYQDGRALAEACLRLAWYFEKFGEIPEDQQRRLMKVAMGQMLGWQLNEHDQRLVKISKKLMAYLREPNPS